MPSAGADGPALASARLPAQRGALTDDADVLSAQTVSDFSSYAQRWRRRRSLRLHVALVHFWDGLDAQAYADALFEAWNLGDMDILLCGAAGEDAFATAMGDGAADLLGRQSAENLMYTSSRFGTLFASQQYDAGSRGVLPGLQRACAQADGRGPLPGRSVRNRAGHTRSSIRVPPVGRGDGRHQR